MNWGFWPQTMPASLGIHLTTSTVLCHRSSLCLTMGPGSRNVSDMLHCCFFFNPTGKNLLCYDFRKTLLSDNISLLIWAAHPFMQVMRHYLSQWFFEGSPAPLSAFRAGGEGDARLSSVPCCLYRMAAPVLPLYCRQVLQQRSSSLSADLSWILVLKVHYWC